MLEFFDVTELTSDEITLKLDHTADADDSQGLLPTYYFDIFIGEARVGRCDLRIGESPVGNVGYTVFPAFRGHGIAPHAVKLLAGLARAHGMASLTIKCKSTNLSSARVCEKLGAALASEVDGVREYRYFASSDRS